jgi:hypothetical protein
MRALMLAPVAMTMLVMGLAGVPLATAQDADCPEGQTDTPEGCSEQAWTEDCPPDMMCAAGEAGGGNASGEVEPAPDCGGEVCAYDTPQQYGNESCIECSGPNDPQQFGNESCIECMPGPVDSCMDGASEGEDCDDDVQYMDDPTRGPSDGSCEFCRGDEAHEEGDVTITGSGKDAPGMAAASALIGLAVIAGLARRK